MSQNVIHVLTRAVIIENDQILVCKTCDLPTPFYFLPGGHVEPGESVRQALKRELLEESGFEFSIQKFLGCFEHSFDPGQNSICHNHEYNFVFTAESSVLRSSSIIPKLEDHIELMWVPFNSLKDIDFRPKGLSDYIPQWLKNLPGNQFQSVMRND